MKELFLSWYKMDDRAIIPTKTPNNAGFDIYTIEDDVVMEPHSQKLFKTGLAVAPSEGWWLMAMDRGSNGSKGLHIHCGVIDNNYRGELFICLKNDNPYPVHINSHEEPGLHTSKQWWDQKDATGTAWVKKEVEIVNYLVYPSTKAIAQIVPVEQPIVHSVEVSEHLWNKYYKNTDRGDGKLGSTGK